MAHLFVQTKSERYAPRPLYRSPIPRGSKQWLQWALLARLTVEQFVSDRFDPRGFETSEFLLHPTAYSPAFGVNILGNDEWLVSRQDR